MHPPYRGQRLRAIKRLATHTDGNRMERHEESKFLAMQKREERVSAGERQRLLVPLSCVPVCYSTD